MNISKSLKFLNKECNLSLPCHKTEIELSVSMYVCMHVSAHSHQADSAHVTDFVFSPEECFRRIDLGAFMCVESDAQALVPSCFLASFNWLRTCVHSFSFAKTNCLVSETGQCLLNAKHFLDRSQDAMTAETLGFRARSLASNVSILKIIEGDFCSCCRCGRTALATAPRLIPSFSGLQLSTCDRALSVSTGRVSEPFFASRVWLRWRGRRLRGRRAKRLDVAFILVVVVVTFV